MAENEGFSANPFAILGVTTRDGRERIMDAAEDRSLTMDPDKCQEARAVLINPRRRIDAELAWFPGVSPGTAIRAASARTVAELDALPLGGIAKINAFLAVASVGAQSSTHGLKDLLRLIASEAEGLEFGTILREVNEDRAVAGIPSFTSVDAVSQALADRRQEWRRSITAILAATPTLVMLEVFHELIDEVLLNGQFLRLFEDVIDDYSLQAQPYVRAEIDAAERIIARIRELAPIRPDALLPLIDAIEKLLRTWERLTRPIQVRATLSGRTDEDSEHLAFAIRSLAIDLFNEHDLLDQSRRLTAMVASNFYAIPKVTDKVAEDSQALENIAEQADQRNVEISYAADIGIFSKTRLSIDRAAFEWKGDLYPLASIRSARWGGTRRSVNGVPTGTDYLIAWSDGRKTARVEFGNATIFEEFTSRIWKTVGNQIVADIVEELRTEKKLRFGSALIGNTTVVIKRKKLFGEEDAEFPWSDITVKSVDGSFVICGPVGTKATSTLSYRDIDNVHFLEALIRHAFSKGQVSLSNAFS